MREELEKNLYEKYPEIFKQRDASPLQTAMCWGVECDDGWYDLIDALCHMIQNHVEYNLRNKHPGATCQAVQVKEKFGGLRFYVEGEDPVIRGMISMAESMSHRICELCGSNREIGRTTGWIKTLCHECGGDLPKWERT